MTVENFVTGFITKTAAMVKHALENPGTDVAAMTRELKAEIMADAGLLEAGPGHDVGDRPAYDRSKEPEIFAGDSSYDDADMDAMEPKDHIAAAVLRLEDRMCTDDADECRGSFAKAMCHLNRYAEKVGDGDGDDDPEIGDPSGEKLKEVEKTYAERAHSTEDLGRNAQRIAKNQNLRNQPGSGHFGGFPKRN